MKNLLICLLLCSCFWIQNLGAQQSEYCGLSTFLESEQGDAFYADLYEKVSEGFRQGTSAKRQATLTVPIVFHIVYNTPAQNIPDSLIHQQITRLNEDFQRLNADTVNTPAAWKSIAAGMDIEFCLAKRDPAGNATSGILRVPTSETSFASVTSYAVPDPVKHDTSGGSDAWNTSDYMNIWVCNLVGATAYTAPPGNFVDPADDGIVCHYNHVGISGVSIYDKGRSIVHEMGHWFGLKHIWGDDNGACTGTDYMADTPNQANWTGSCPTFPVTDSCSPNSPGIMFMNYMDYTSDDCRNLFTQAQVNYMNAVYDAIMQGYYLQDKCTHLATVNSKEQHEPVIFSQNGYLHIETERQIEKVRLWDSNGRMLMESNGEDSIEIQSLGRGLVIVEIHFADGKIRRWKVQMAN